MNNQPSMNMMSNNTPPVTNNTFNSASPDTRQNQEFIKELNDLKGTGKKEEPPRNKDPFDFLQGM